MKGLFAATGYDVGWTQYQTMLINKLNELTAGQPIEHMYPKDLVIQFARDPMNAAVFNYASGAHNNHLFYSTLAPQPLEMFKVPALRESLIKAFGSIETLQMTFLDTAAAMFGPGYVWLVWAKNVSSPASASSLSTAPSSSRSGGWRILTTYLAGTPYAEAGYRQQSTNMSNQPNTGGAPANFAGAFGAFSASGRANAHIPPGGTSVMPVLCVSTWEHTYLYDYGQNKREYLNRWWDAIDWAIVDQNAPTEAKSPRPAFYRE